MDIVTIKAQKNNKWLRKWRLLVTANTCDEESCSDCCPIIRTILIVYISVPVIADIFRQSILY